MKLKHILFGLLAFALIALPATANAQSYVGTPGGGYLATPETFILTPQVKQPVLFGGIGLPSGANAYTIGGAYGVLPDLTVSGSYTLISPDFNGAKNLNQFNVAGAYSLNNQISLGDNVYTAATGSLNYISEDGESTLNIPLGLAIGTTLPLGTDGKLNLSPYIAPQLVYARFSGEGWDGSKSSESDTFLGTSAGATVGFGNAFAGASIAKLFEDGADAVFSIQVGFTF